MVRPKVRLTISLFEFEFCSGSFLNSSHSWRSNQAPVQKPFILTYNMYLAFRLFAMIT
jgi:hypothetical protein